MAADRHGHVDAGPDGFIARFDGDAAWLERIQTIQRHHWSEQEQAWIVPWHWPSARRLLHIASELSWTITPAARAAELRVKEESELLEYGVDVVQDNHGQAWFRCEVADDDELMAKVRALRGAFWDDFWWVPTDWEQCCGPLLEIVESDSRLEVSPAARRLLTEPDVSHLHVRSSAPPSAAVRTHALRPHVTQQAQGLLLEDWSPSAHDLVMHGWSRATQAEGFAVSPALRCTLLPFQLAGVRYLLAAERAFLADETGLGKTVQALAALETAAAYPALIVCPANAMRTWQVAAERWLPASRSVALLQPGAEQTDVCIASYASLLDHQEALRPVSFAAIIADESHYLKHRESKRTQAVLAVAATVTGLRFCLSGEPLPDQPIALATQLEFLGLLDAELGGFWAFAERYCAPQETDYGTLFGAANLDELEQRLRSRGYCRREKHDVQPQLAAKMRRIVSLELEDRPAYEAARDQCLESLRSLTTANGSASKPAYLEVIQRLLHACGRQKVAGLGDWLARFVARAEPLVVFAQHRDVIDALKSRFPQAVTLQEDDPAHARERALQAFQSGESGLIICSMKLASAELTFTRAAQLAFAEVSWNAAEHARAEECVRHIGQAPAWYLVAEGTIDDVVLRALARTRDLDDASAMDESVLQEISDAIARRVDTRRKSRSTRQGNRDQNRMPGEDADTALAQARTKLGPA